MREMQMKTTVRFHLPNQNVQEQKTMVNKCWSGKGNPHALLLGLQSGVATMEISVEKFSKY